MRTGLTADIVAAELLKVRKRWLPYVFLLPVVALLALQVFAAYFAGWRHDHDQSALRASVLPASLSGILDLIQYLGAVVLGIFAASAVATEFAWGTVRQALVRGQTRTQFLTAKLLGLALIGALGFLLVLSLALMFSGIVTALEGRHVSGPSVGDGVLMVLRAAFSIAPYLLLSFCLAVVGRSTTLGAGGILIFVIAESIVLGVLGGIGGAAADARAFLLGHNVSALLAVGRPEGSEQFVSLAPRPSPPLSELPDPAVAALVVAVYCLMFLAIAYAVFQRRDLTSEAGGS